MSAGFDLDTRWARDREQFMTRNLATPEDVQEQVGFFSGAGGTFGAELATAARSVAMLGGAIPVGVDWLVGDDNMTGKPLADQYFDLIEEPTRRAVEYWRPNPAMTGAGGRVAGAVAGGLVQLAATGGNPTLMIARQQAGTAAELVDQGVDADTAQTVGLAQGAATAIGFKLASVGNTLAKQMATGAAGNLATNVPAAIASEQVLKAGGYEEQAKQFDPLNMEARAVDVLMGAAFGAVSYAGKRPAVMPEPEIPPVKLPPSEQAALLGVASELNWRDSAPGTPKTQADAAMHHNAMLDALESMLKNEPVEVAAKVEGAQFEPKPPTPEADISGAFREVFGEDMPARQVVEESAPDLQPAKPAEPVAPQEPAVKPEQPAQMAEPELPEVAAARAAVARQADDAMIDIGTEDAPNIVNMKQAWEQADAELKQAKTDSGAYMAAITCLLGG